MDEHRGATGGHGFDCERGRGGEDGGGVGETVTEGAGVVGDTEFDFQAPGETPDGTDAKATEFLLDTPQGGEQA
jgi:hypothetical protein